MTVDPRRLSDDKLLRAIAELKRHVVTLDLQPVAEPPRALPGSTTIKRLKS